MNINLFQAYFWNQGPNIYKSFETPPPGACPKKIRQWSPGLSRFGTPDHDGRIGSIHAATKAGISLAIGKKRDPYFLMIAWKSLYNYYITGYL